VAPQAICVKPGPCRNGVNTENEGGELLLLGAPQTAGVRFCYRVRPDPAQAL